MYPNGIQIRHAFQRPIDHRIQLFTVKGIHPYTFESIFGLAEHVCILTDGRKVGFQRHVGLILNRAKIVFRAGKQTKGTQAQK